MCLDWGQLGHKSDIKQKYKKMAGFLNFIALGVKQQCIALSMYVNGVNDDDNVNEEDVYNGGKKFCLGS